MQFLGETEHSSWIQIKKILHYRCTYIFIISIVCLSVLLLVNFDIIKNC